MVVVNSSRNITVPHGGLFLKNAVSKSFNQVGARCFFLLKGLPETLQFYVDADVLSLYYIQKHKLKTFDSTEDHVCV